MIKAMGDSFKKDIDVIRGKPAKDGSVPTTGEKVGAVGKFIAKGVGAFFVSGPAATMTALMGVVGLADAACVGITGSRINGEASPHTPLQPGAW
jgi:hypothetical protein